MIINTTGARYTIIFPIVSACGAALKLLISNAHNKVELFRIITNRIVIFVNWLYDYFDCIVSK